MDKERIITDIKKWKELNPDQHDGSYELMREIVSSYSRLEDYSKCTFLDLNAIYTMAVGSWKANAEKKKEYVRRSCLPVEEMNRIDAIVDYVWDNACHKRYGNIEHFDKPTFGMFGTGFYSFDKSNAESVQDFIKMLVDISKLEDDEQIYIRAEQVLTKPFKGMKAASASVILHCLKPYVFPILNGKFGNDNIFILMGVDLDHPAELNTYIDNCRKINKFRNDNFTIKNYRIFDLVSIELSNNQDIEYIPLLDEYNPNLSSDFYFKFLQDEEKVKKLNLDTLYYLYKMGGEASCTQIAQKYGNTPSHYNINAINTAKVVQMETKCEISKRDSNDKDRYWAILFQGRKASSKEEGQFIWKMREPLREAICALDELGFFDEVFMAEKTYFAHNMILYGPPGTGKTYHTVIYAVAIIENTALKEIEDEAKNNYDAVKKRYDRYYEEGKIEFTTFHQSYSYEEFIEGIKPVVDTDKENISYKIADGVFKRFCEKARNISNKEELSGRVWALRNKKNDTDSPDEYLRSIYEEGVYKLEDDSDRNHQNNYISEMEIGDWVVFGRNYNIDAIGVVSGDDCETIEDGIFHVQRKIEWRARNINADIRKINHGRGFSNFSISKSTIKVNDLQRILNSNERNDKPHVFIIDEINRGNISKIFGELITLIETTKRENSEEETSATLPYSGDKFCIPSNVYILGTMNTADRSISLMDTALRRRFSFVEMMPDSNVLREINADKITQDGKTLNVADMLDVINERIEFLFDREHTIGHAFFTKLAKDPSIEHLAMIFEKSVIPLLQEYFYEDYSRIQLVLGDDGKTTDDKKEYQFIRDIRAGKDIFNTTPDIDIPQEKYCIQKSALTKINSYKLISNKL